MTQPPNTPHPAPRTQKGARIAHIGLALRSFTDLAPLFRDVLGMKDVPLADSDGARITGFQAGDALVELFESERPDSPIARFLEKRGPGIHHVCLSVDDLDATLAACRAAGVTLVDQVPRIGAEGKRIAFLHPKSTGGVLVELTEY